MNLQPRVTQSRAPLRRAPAPSQSPRAAWLQEAIFAGKKFHINRQRRWLHNAINLSGLVLIVVLIAGVFGAAAYLPAWLYLVLAPPVLGCLVYSLYILVIHECSHGLFLVLRSPRSTQRVNHQLGDLIAIPLLTDYRRHWQEGHIAHHTRPLEPERDSQVPRVADGRALFGLLLRLALIPLYAVKTNPSKKYRMPLSRVVGALVFWSSVGAVVGFYVAWYAPLALLYLFNFVLILNVCRIAQEHGSGLQAEPHRLLRARDHFYFGQRLTTPFHMNYHLEHHLNMSVPWYNLPAYHEEVKRCMPEELQPYFINRGLRQIWEQLCGKRPQLPEALRHLVGAAPLTSGVN